MGKVLKSVPMHHNGKVIYLTLIKEEIKGKDKTKEFDTNFHVVPRDENGEILPAPKDQHEKWNMVHFLLCKYLWNTSQPVQWVTEVEDETKEDRWEQVAEDV